LALAGAAVRAEADSRTTGQHYRMNKFGDLVRATGSDGSDATPSVVTVNERRAGVSMILGGTVVPFKEVTLTAQIPGRVEFVAGQEGDRFERGTLLAAINDDELLARRQQAVANLNAAEYTLRNSQMQYGREWWAPESRNINRAPGMGFPSLFDQFFTRNFGQGLGYGNPFLERYTDLYGAGTHVGQAYAQRMAAISEIQQIEAKLRDAATVAPFNGVIVQKPVEPGDTVQPGQPLVKFADLTDLQLDVEVPSRLMSGLQTGMVVRAFLDANDSWVDARVARIYPVGDTQRHTFTVKFDLPVNVDARPGSYAEVILPDTGAAVENLIEIPKSAVIERGSLPAVFVVEGNRRELRLVRIGASYAPGRVTVLAGLRPGDRIMVNPPKGMRSGWIDEPPKFSP
jgi:multidrug efflux pump subunit AcrA (membrane-fusion protein)